MHKYKLPNWCVLFLFHPQPGTFPDESFSSHDQLPMRPEHASIIRDFYSNQNSNIPFPTSTQPTPRSYKWTVVSGALDASPPLPTSSLVATTETILVTTSAYYEIHNESDTINHTHLASNATTLEGASADSNKQQQKHHADVLQQPHRQLHSTVRQPSRAAIKPALSPTLPQLSTLAATTNSSMMPLMKTHKTDAPMLNYIFDSHLATNKHHHHDRWVRITPCMCLYVTISAEV